ncbi:hypothetical protein VDGL01_09570 [Verticillium dahliae]|nr:hypothetical protein VD0003_g6970 [Verticillium dahliae]
MVCLRIAVAELKLSHDLAMLATRIDESVACPIFLSTNTTNGIR